MIRCEKVSFDYGSTPILRGASFGVGRGELTALVGRNGVGKSTTLRLLAGLLRPKQGEIKLAGLDPLTSGARLKSRLGVVPDGLGLFEELTLEEQLVLVGRVHGLGIEQCRVRAVELGNLLGFRDAFWARARIASQGTRKKAALALALLPDPDILLLDEPFEGVDPGSARRIESLLVSLASRGRAILFTVHDLTLVRRMAPRILLAMPGGIITERNLAELDLLDFGETEIGAELPTWLRSSSC